MEITPKQFAIICFMVMMDHHGEGYIQAHPDYALEKIAILNLGYADAFVWLDQENQQEVLAFLEHWKFKVPETIIN